MKQKLFITVIFILITAIFLAGCSQNGQSKTDVNANVSATETTAANTEIKRAELTENVGYAMDLTIEPNAANANSEVALNFSVKDKAGKPFNNLKIVHEKLMHLLIVSDDLAFFDHVHPERQADGSFKLNYKFPAGGAYKLYADFTPENSPQIVNVFDVNVEGTPREKTPLVADANFTKRIDDLTFTMKANTPIKAANGEMLNFFVTDASGKPVTDLQPYLGAMAHFVVISEDGSKFLHVHAEAGQTTETKGAGGHGDHNDKHGEMEMDVKPDPKNTETPTVVAHTEFPTGGIYKLWGQFQRGGKVYTVPFVLNVAPAANTTAKNAEIPSDAVKITVSKNGFEPSEVKVEKGKPAKLAFYRADAENCGSEIVFSKLNITRKLPVGETVLIEFTPDQAGDISFSCGMDMLKGKVIVN